MRSVQTLRGVGHRPLRGAGQAVQLVPQHGHRHAQPGPCARRPGGHGGGAFAVAQVVDKDAAAPVGRAALGDETLRDGVRQVLHHRLGEALHGVERPERSATNGMYYMKLLKRDVGEMAQQVLLQGGSTDQVLGFASASMTGYKGPEESRTQFRKHQRQESRKHTANILQTLREQGSGGW